MWKLLFICSKNRWRSPTAEMLFKNHPLHSARSAGTSDKARIKVNLKLMDWADVIFVMERKHKNVINRRFSHVAYTQNIVVLNIEDNYQFNDPELKEILKEALTEYL